MSTRLGSMGSNRKANMPTTGMFSDEPNEGGGWSSSSTSSEDIPLSVTLSPLGRWRTWKGGALAQSTDAKVEGYESNERDEQKRVVQVYFDSCCCVYVPWYHHGIVSWLMFAFPCT
jgi:hypothetical protein